MVRRGAATRTEVRMILLNMLNRLSGLQLRQTNEQAHTISNESFFRSFVAAVEAHLLARALKAISHVYISVATKFATDCLCRATNSQL
jgi:hypothetical protein